MNVEFLLLSRQTKVDAERGPMGSLEIGVFKQLILHL